MTWLQRIEELITKFIVVIVNIIVEIVLDIQYLFSVIQNT